MTVSDTTMNGLKKLFQKRFPQRGERPDFSED